MHLIQIGLVDTTGEIDPALIRATAAALNVQVARDVAPFWAVHASVSVLPDARHIPPGVWPVRLVADLPPPEGGFHLTRHNQPFAKVKATPASDHWTMEASHEVIEMLVDPSGNRLKASRSIEIVKGRIQDGPGEFEYLVEACDPCESAQCAYSIQGIAVSDFITPHFYDPLPTPGTRYSYTGALTAPRQIAPGGYISWLDPHSQEWRQLQNFDAATGPTIVDLGLDSATSMRTWIHARMNSNGHGRPAAQAVTPPQRGAPLFDAAEQRLAFIGDSGLTRARNYL